MCLASLPARAAAQARAVEAFSPALAANATSPVRVCDLVEPVLTGLFKILMPPELLEAALRGPSSTLRDARRFYADTCFKMPVSIIRRLVWRGLVRGLELYATVGSDTQLNLLRSVTVPVRGLFILLCCPFYVKDKADRETAVREAARRCAWRAQAHSSLA
jgi:hypothetical protein